jgi:hypothetical protein
MSEKIQLSYGNNYNGIVVDTTATPGTPIHQTAISHLIIDYLHLWASNGDADKEPRKVTVEFGGVTDPDNLICKEVIVMPDSPPRKIVDGIPISGDSLVVALIAVFADEADDVTIYGYVERVRD